jgi:hypothetical protein
MPVWRVAVQDHNRGLTCANLYSILDQMGSAPAETRRISSARPRLSAATTGVSGRWRPEVFGGRAAPGTPGTGIAGAGTAGTGTAGTGTAGTGTAGTGTAGTGTLPVLSALRELLPRGGLARGSVVAVAEFGLLALALAAGASADGAWCGIAGVPEAGVLAAADLGLDTERTLLVPDPGSAWPQVVASLLDGCELVLLRPPAQPPAQGAQGVHGTQGVHGAQVRQRLEATLRRSRGVLLVVGDWPGAQVRLQVLTQGWTGLGDGHGRLRACCAQVMADGRGEAAVARTRWLWLPAEDGSVTVADPADIPAASIPAADSSSARSPRRLRVVAG